MKKKLNGEFKEMANLKRLIANFENDPKNAKVLADYNELVNRYKKVESKAKEVVHYNVAEDNEGLVKSQRKVYEFENDKMKVLGTPSFHFAYDLLTLDPNDLRILSLLKVLSINSKGYMDQLKEGNVTKGIDNEIRKEVFKNVTCKFKFNI